MSHSHYSFLLVQNKKHRPGFELLSQHDIKKARGIKALSLGHEEYSNILPVRSGRSKMNTFLYTVLS